MIKGVDFLIKWAKWIAALSLMGMVFLTCADVGARYFGYPVFGTYEIVGFMLIVLVAFSLPYTQRSEGHIFIETVVSRLPQRAQSVVHSVTTSLSLVIVAVIIWQSVVFGTHMWKVSQLSMTLRVPLFPFIYIIALGFTLMWLALWLDLVSVMMGWTRK